MTGEAHQDCLEVVRAHPEVRGVYHCYSGSLEDAKVLVKLGWMLSFTGVITYKMHERLWKSSSGCPWTGSWWRLIPPISRRSPSGASATTREGPSGGRGHCQVKGMDPEEAARITLENGTRFFRIEI